jgi:predicted outer membrane repeat protein
VDGTFALTFGIAIFMLSFQIYDFNRTATTTIVKDDGSSPHGTYNEKINMSSTSSRRILSTNNTNATIGDDAPVQGDTILILSALSLINTFIFVIPTSIKYAIQKQNCLKAVASNATISSDTCICSVGQLRTLVDANTFDNFEVFILCPAITLELDQPIDITSKSFRLVCGTSRFINKGPCTITKSDSVATSRLLVGAPNDVAIQDITLSGGVASNFGGAVYILGGAMTFQDVLFEGNTATQRGGALYISNSAIVQIFGTTTFRNNNAVGIGGGNDMYIAESNSFGNVQCVPSTKLDQPKFCNGLTDGIVIEGASTDDQKAAYTNCFGDTLVDSKC